MFPNHPEEELTGLYLKHLEFGMSTQEQPDGVTKEAFRESQISGIRRKSILLSHLQNINLGEDRARGKSGDVDNFDVD
jgi:hypothetical protein